MPIRSDLALEAADSFISGTKHLDGISLSTYQQGRFKISDVKVSSPAAAKEVGKPIGRYITLESCNTLDCSCSLKEDAMALGCELTSLIGRPKSVLIVGLGNDAVTPDSLGTSVADKIIATRHLETHEQKLRDIFSASVSVIKPGVMGQTGIESCETVKAASDKVKPDLILLIDAFACRAVSRMGSCVQISDSGICPGSGVMNSRAEISEKTTGVKCISLGVPTMCDCKESGMMVTPKNIDKIISHCARLLGYAVNMSLHPKLDINEIELLSE